MDKKTIITTLIKQHHVLQSDLELVNNLISNSENTDTEKIIQFLKKFEENLFEHLELENGKFYPELLRNMESKGQDTTKTELFIAEMKNIEKGVVTFLEKYKKSQSIKENMEEFKNNFSSVVETLNLRIESEEAGVYSYWGLF
jgi:regulator of sigma D